MKAANADAAVCARDGNVDSQTDGIHGVRDQHTIRSRRIFGLTALSALMLGFWAGCVPDPGFELDSFHPSSNQRLIARYYEDEALRLRQQAEEFEARAEMYERTFGPDSDWVTSAKLLAQSYRLAADDRERLAKEHLEAGRDHRSPASLRQQTSSERTP